MKSRKQEIEDKGIMDKRDKTNNSYENESSTKNEEKQRLFRLLDGTGYNLDALEEDPLLKMISQWDYPIFDLAESSNRQLLSHVSVSI